MVTGQQVFDIAMGLIDEVSESGGLVVENPGYYKTKVATFLTILHTELLPISLSPLPITDLSQPLQLADRVCLSVLPYGLAAHLLMTEDAASASFFNDRYEEMKRKQTTQSEPIVDAYGVLDGLRGE